MGLHSVYALQVRMPIVPCAASIGFHGRLHGVLMGDRRATYPLDVYYMMACQERITAYVVCFMQKACQMRSPGRSAGIDIDGNAIQLHITQLEESLTGSFDHSV